MMSEEKTIGRFVRFASILVAVFAVFPALAQQPAATWSMATALPQGRSEIQAATIDGKIYVLGGAWTETKDGQQIEHFTDGFTTEYDPMTQRWRERTRAPEGRTHQGIAVLGGKIYLAGGFAGRAHSLPSAGVYSYDPASDHWQSLAPLSWLRGSVALAAVGGKLHSIGGRIMGEAETLATHEVYDPATNSWHMAAPLPTARDHAGVFVADGKIHIVGGRTGEGTANVALHDVYDPATDKWTAAPPMPTPRSSGAFAEYHGLVFYAGGECRDRKTYDEVEAYDLKAGRWLKFPALPAGRHAFAAAVTGNKLFFIGGALGCGGSGKVPDMLQLTFR
jgi:N-acetylneuraminic acid mutarotase